MQDALFALQIVGVVWFLVGVLFPSATEASDSAHRLDRAVDAVVPFVDTARTWLLGLMALGAVVAIGGLVLQAPEIVFWLGLSAVMWPLLIVGPLSKAAVLMRVVRRRWVACTFGLVLIVAPFFTQ